MNWLIEFHEMLFYLEETKVTKVDLTDLKLFYFYFWKINFILLNLE